MNSTDANLGTSVKPVDPDSLLREAHSAAWRQGSKTENVYTGGVLRLDIHLDGDWESNCERIAALVNAYEQRIDTPLGSGTIIGGRAFSSLLNLYRHAITHAQELALVGAVAILEKQNDRDQLARASNNDTKIPDRPRA